MSPLPFVRPAVLLVGSSVVAACLVGSTTAAAPPISVSAQETWAGDTAPVSIPGARLREGDRIPHDAVLVFRRVTVTGRSSKRQVRLTVPKGTRLTGIALSPKIIESAQVGTGQGNYVGRRHVTFTVRGHTGDGGTLTFYAYGR